MIDIISVRQDLVLAERMAVEFMMPQSDATEYALKVLTEGNSEDILNALCNGTLNLTKLTEFMPLQRIRELVGNAEKWLNIYARGEEMIQIITYSGQLTSTDILVRFRKLMDVFEKYGLVKISHSAESGLSQYSITLNVESY